MAVVARVNNWVVHAGGQAHRGWLPPGAARPLPLPRRDVVLDLCLEDAGGGVLLLWEIVQSSPDFPETSLRQGDTWHASVEAAKEQATFNFGVPAELWAAV